ncbi:MAG: multicopper oxidase family protein [Arthrobacter sp.]|uniref:multicopper oxidase family protein n=1 Tax=Arthrobacter sp. TaxID=1667 RepID=UPI003480B463
MKPLTRRQAIALGATGAAATAAGAAGLLWSARIGSPGGPDDDVPGARDAWTASPSVSSSDGVLEVRLEAAAARRSIGGRDADVRAYNGTVPGPTLRLRPGDRLRVRLANGLDDPTNLHTHGLHASPAGNGDNPFLEVPPGATFDYEIDLPPDHPSGTFWYHPHHHGMVADQLWAGLYGAIVVEDTDPVPATRERVLLVSDLTLDTAGHLHTVTMPERMMGRMGATVLVGGRTFPRLDAAPGDRELWRLVNACPTRFLRLDLEGATARLIARDGHRLASPRDAGDLVLAPGNPADLLVSVGDGTATLRSLAYDRGDMGAMMGRGAGRGGTMDAEPTEPLDLLRIVPSAGTDAADVPAPANPTPANPAPRDLRDRPVAARRDVVFAMMGRGMGPGGMSPTINGRSYDADRTDITVEAGTVEEWRIVNTSPLHHPFHLHVWPMQVVHDGTAVVDAPDWRDVVVVPANGEATVLVAFDGIAGRTVFHCHILDHEDLGMMGVIEVR